MSSSTATKSMGLVTTKPRLEARQAQILIKNRRGLGRATRAINVISLVTGLTSARTVKAANMAAPGGRNLMEEGAASMAAREAVTSQAQGAKGIRSVSTAISKATGRATARSRDGRSPTTCKAAAGTKGLNRTDF